VAQGAQRILTPIEGDQNPGEIDIALSERRLNPERTLQAVRRFESGIQLLERPAEIQPGERHVGSQLGGALEVLQSEVVLADGRQDAAEVEVGLRAQRFLLEGFGERRERLVSSTEAIERDPEQVRGFGRAGPGAGGVSQGLIGVTSTTSPKQRAGELDGRYQARR
jgi:hypothetical protein